VEIYAEVLNDGGSTARGVVVEALIGDSLIASSAPIDVAAALLGLVVSGTELDLRESAAFALSPKTPIRRTLPLWLKGK
jgi:hypothetical protein